MTAQEIYEREGFLPLSSRGKYQVGQMAQLNSKALGIYVRFDCSVKIIGILSEPEFREIEGRYLSLHPGFAKCQGPYFYKVIAE